MKVCNKCNIEKELIDFYVDKRSKDNHRNTCKSCEIINAKKWKSENLERSNQYQKEWRENNREYKSPNHHLSKESAKKWRDKNPDYNKKYYEKNKDVINEKKKEYDKEWRKNNREYSIRYSKEWRDRNKEKIKEKNIKNKDKFNKNRSYKRKNDVIYKLYHSIGTSIRLSLKRNGYSKKTRTYEILGCSFEEFKLHLESKFEPWMTWENRGLYNGELYYGWDIDHIIPISLAKTEEDIIRLNHYTNLQPLCSKINRDIKINKLIYLFLNERYIIPLIDLDRT